MWEGKSSWDSYADNDCLPRTSLSPNQPSPQSSGKTASSRTDDLVRGPSFSSLHVVGDVTSDPYGTTRTDELARGPSLSSLRVIGSGGYQSHGTFQTDDLVRGPSLSSQHVIEPSDCGLQGTPSTKVIRTEGQLTHNPSNASLTRQSSIRIRNRPSNRLTHYQNPLPIDEEPKFIVVEGLDSGGPRVIPLKPFEDPSTLLQYHIENPSVLLRYQPVEPVNPNPEFAMKADIKTVFNNYRFQVVWEPSMSDRWLGNYKLSIVGTWYNHNNILSATANEQSRSTSPFRVIFRGAHDSERGASLHMEEPAYRIEILRELRKDFQNGLFNRASAGTDRGQGLMKTFRRYLEWCFQKSFVEGVNVQYQWTEEGLLTLNSILTRTDVA